MFLIGLLDCIQLFLQIYDGLILIFGIFLGSVYDGVRLPFNHFKLLQFFRGVLSSLWDTTLILTLLLAYNRFAAIVMDDFPWANSSLIYYVSIKLAKVFLYHDAITAPQTLCSQTH